MKRLVQFVVLIAVVLLAAQPASGYLFCSQGSCPGGACSLACCGDMPGMGDDGSVHSRMDCGAMMESLPAGSGCGQLLPSVAAVTQDAAMAAPASGDDHAAVPLPVLTPDLSARTGGAASPPAIGSRDTIDRGVLFQVFRI